MQTLQAMLMIIHDILYYWFPNNQIKANPDKCHLLPKSSDRLSWCVENNSIESSKGGNFRGPNVNCNNNVNCNVIVDEISREAGQKLKFMVQSYF